MNAKPPAATSATMNRLLFILFCGTVILAGIPTADAYTVIALYSRQGQGPQYQHFQYNHHGNNVSRATVEKLALEGVSAEGGINPKIVVSTGKPDISRQRFPMNKIVASLGWSGPQSSAEAAANEAIAKCKKSGGTDPHIKAQWHDYYHSFDKHV